MDELPRQGNGSQNWRVKVYLLNTSGNWDDCGAGILDIFRDKKLGEDMEMVRVTPSDDFIKNNPPPVAPERLKKLKGESENERAIICLPMLRHYQYEKQGDSIISWVDKSVNEEIAISFLDASAAKDTWRHICMYLGKNPNEDKKNQYKDLDKLPMPSMENLEQIRTELDSKKDWMVCAIMENRAFLDKLYQVFRDLEDLESVEHLHFIHDIIRQLIFSEEVNLLEMLLSDEYYLLVFGALEYDSEVAGSTRPKYREFLNNQSYYKKVIDFQDETILKKIRLNYRISYLKDSVITSIIDDPLTSQFNPISYYTNHEIFEHIMANDRYIDELFSKLTGNLKYTVGFLYELTQLVKTMVQLDEKVEFCRKLVGKKVFNTIAQAFSALNAPAMEKEIEDDKKNILKINLVDILFFIIQLELNAFIEFLKTPAESSLMIEGIINNFLYGDQGLQIQTGELLKYLIDTLHEKKNEILDIFYEKFMPAFVEHYKKLENDEKFYSFVQQFIDILVHCIKSHGYRIRHYIIHHKLLHKLYPGFQVRDKSLHLAIIRLIKNIALSKDEFLIKYITNNNLLDDIFDVYTKNAFKSNLINSACLEFFEVIRKENIKKLIIEFTQRFRDRVKELGLERFFEKLFSKYDQLTEDANRDTYLETPEPQNRPSSGMSTPKPENFENYNSRELSYMEDEEYFEADDDEDDASKNKTAPVVEKPNDENVPTPPPLNQQPQEANNVLTEQQLKMSKDSIQKMKNKIASKKLEAEEENKFVFGNKGRRSSSSERPPNTINIQFSMSMSDDESKSSDSEGSNSNGKRLGSDLTSDEEINEGGKADPQKRVKF